MAPTGTIETSLDGLYKAPRARVYLSDRLSDDGWKFQPHLTLERLRTCAAPDVDQAEFRWIYGPQSYPETPRKFETVAPLDGLLRFVKVEIDDTASSGRDPIRWFGVIEVDQRQASGSARNIPRGEQSFVAFGLVRLLERRIVDKTVVETLSEAGDVAAVEIPIGLPFNVRERGFMIPDRGNRMNRKSAAADQEGYLFADVPDRAEEWNALQAAEYLLRQFPPRDLDGDPIADCRLQCHGDNLLEWYDVTVATDRRSVKAILDDLIDRRRGVGYWVAFDEGELVVHVFSFLDADLVLTTDADGERRIGANESPRRLNFERAVDIESAVVRNNATIAYDRIVVEGERRTSTCTLQFHDSARIASGQNGDVDPRERHFIQDWEQSQEDAYLVAASSDSDYGTLDPVAQYERNAYRRTQTDVAHVFARFKLNRDWDGRVQPPDLPFVRNPVFPHAEKTGEAVPQWVFGLRIFPTTVLRSGVDYRDSKIADGLPEEASFVGPDGVKTERPFLPILLAANCSTLEGDQWVAGDRLNATAHLEDGGRRWAVHAHNLHHAPVLRLNVIGGPQHFLAYSPWTDPTNPSQVPQIGDVDERDDPEKNQAIDWTDLEITLSFETQEFAAVEARVARTGDAVPTSRMERVLRIKLHDARLDYVVPYTTVAIEDGERVTSEGGYVRDDRPRMRAIAKAAAQWYGVERQAMQLTFYQVRDLVRVGDLIVDVGAHYNRADVKTPVTAVTYDFTGDKPRTEFETSYADLDFS